jgi:uncharacterized protein YjbI with pentapeptide repeats
VFIPGSGEALPLVAEIQALVAAGARGVVYLIGPIGSGKTTALQHLAALLPADGPVALLDDSKMAYGDLGGAARILVRAASSPGIGPTIAVHRLAPWDTDDLIEYLLAVHREKCASVMVRLHGADRDLLGGVPELWRIVLDQLANDPSILDARGALSRYLQIHLSDPDRLERARGACLTALTTGSAGLDLSAEIIGEAQLPPTIAHYLRHPQVQLLLAAQRAVADLRVHADCAWLAMRLPRELVRSVAQEVRGEQDVVTHLGALIARPANSHAMAASILHAVDQGWVPVMARTPVLAGAYLDHAGWPGVQLPQANLHESDLSNANLSRANLDGANACGADLSQVCLAFASLAGFQAVGSELTEADMVSVYAPASNWDRANLEGANLANADVSGASFRETKCKGTVFAGANLANSAFAEVELEEADFTGADLRNAKLSKLRLRDAVFSDACFAGADLSGSDLEGMNLPAVDFQGANLTGALLTGAVLSDAILRDACLREAGLGDVDLEGACLAGADLQGASFHMGSTRSGLLFTPIASEGTRTGFYTDDADEQNFKAPEEIRKANLSRADLRGAKIEGVDFYLVDLRGALYDADQELHFRRCRAIMKQ